MIFSRVKNGLKIIIGEEDKKYLAEIKEENGGLESDKAMYDFFDPYLCNDEFRWIYPEEIGALTSAPILGIMGYKNKRDEEKGRNEIVVEAYAYMDYQVKSMLEDLEEFGEAFLTSGD